MSEGFLNSATRPYSSPNSNTPLEPPPGLHWIDWIETSEPAAWTQALSSAMKNPPAPATQADYDTWLSLHNNPWANVLRNPC